MLKSWRLKYLLDIRTGSPSNSYIPHNKARPDEDVDGDVDGDFDGDVDGDFDGDFDGDARRSRAPFPGKTGQLRPRLPRHSKIGGISSAKLKPS